MDMVFCGLPGLDNAPLRRSEDNDYYHFEDSSECSEAATLPIDEVEDETREYYNVTATLPKVRLIRNLKIIQKILTMF